MIVPVHHPVFTILVLLGALGVSIYRHHQTENDIQKLCRMVSLQAVSYRNVQTVQETVASICAQHQQDVYL
jgi:hypothetical protein